MTTIDPTQSETSINGGSQTSAGHTDPPTDTSGAELECLLEFAQHDGLAANLERQFVFIGAGNRYVELQALKCRKPKTSFRPMFAAHVSSIDVAVMGPGRSRLLRLRRQARRRRPRGTPPGRPRRI